MHFPRLFFLLFLFLVLILPRVSGQNQPMVEAQLESAMVVVGEETYLTVLTQGIPPSGWPEAPDVAPLTLEQEEMRPFQVRGYIRKGFRYRLSASTVGTYPIPPFVFRTPSGEIRSKPLVLRVHPMDALATHGIKIAGSVTPYLTGIFLEKEKPYVGEMQEVEAKLYLSQAPPNRLKLADGKVIKLDKDGLAAWRFTSRREETGSLDYDGHLFRVYTYRSSVNALREGSLVLGPGEAEAVFYQRARPFIESVQFPSVQLEALPLPEGAPEGFEGAVGQFAMTVRPLTVEIELGDTITVESEISGRGNLEQFPGPRLVDPEDQWKTFEMIAKPSGAERRESTGSVEFSQVIRPREKVAKLPPFRFVFFNPLLKDYQLLESPPVPLSVTGGASSDGKEGGGLPFLTPGNAGLKSFSDTRVVPIWIWQVIPAIFALFLIARVLRHRWMGRQISRMPRAEFEEALATVEKKTEDRAAFYREAAHMAARWRAGEDLAEIFETRDDICFRPEPDSQPVKPGEKKRILKLLRSLAPLVTAVLAIFSTDPARAALPDDPAQAKAEILVLMDKQPAPEHYHNLALCEKALGNPGAAALWAYRFKLQGGDATDLLSDLPGMRMKDRKWLDWIALFPKNTYLQIGLAGIWALLILILVALFYHERRREVLIGTLSIFCPLALGLGFTCWFLYPAEISFAPLHELSVVTEAVPLRAQPFEGGKEMMDSLEGSLCKVRKTQSDWAYLTLPGGLSGWVREASVSPINP